ncbi:MAG: hypothetical protein LBS14_02250, partial [Holosporaceae bacterium]|nr:hypothetical protein [Holosporaceae bacterium]
MVSRRKFRGISASVASLAWAFGAFDALSMNSVVSLPTNSGTRPYQPMSAVAALPEEKVSSLESRFESQLAALRAENAELKAQLFSTLAQVQRFEADLLTREQKSKEDFLGFCKEFGTFRESVDGRFASLGSELAAQRTAQSPLVSLSETVRAQGAKLDALLTKIPQHREYLLAL